MVNLDEIQKYINLSSWLSRAVILLLGLSIGWLGIAGINSFFQNAGVKVQGSATAIVSHESSSARSLAELDLFGASPTSDIEVVKAEATKLNLTLRGIYYQKQGDASMAIIQDNANKIEEHYVIGDSVFNLAVLEQIHIDRVILFHNGRYETLRLPRKSLGIEFLPDVAVVASKAIQEFRNDLLTGNMEKYVFHVDYETVYDDDGFVGFRILGDSENGREILSKIGLANGDVVTEINGVILASDKNALSVVKDLRGAKKATIGINRDGATQYLHLDFTQ